MALLEALSKIGLVKLEGAETGPSSPEVSEADLAALLNTDTLPKTAPAPAPAGATPAVVAASVPAPSTGLDENSSFVDIYTRAGVAPSNYTAEKLFKLLEGLATLPNDEVRRVSVMAIDNADDNWEIGEPMADAQNKITALKQAKIEMEGNLQNAATAAQASIAKEDEVLKQTSDIIRAEISKLEERLQNETAEITANKGKIEATLAQKQRDTEAKQVSLDTEVSRFENLRKLFASEVSTPIPVSTPTV